MNHCRTPLWWLEGLSESPLNTLFLRLEGMQAWGDRALANYRTTFEEPSKSGIVGLLAACLGVNTDADLRRLTELITIGVRTDRPATFVTDLHTIQDAYNANGEPRLKLKSKTEKEAEEDGEEGQTILTERVYLHDPSYLVAVRATLPGLIERLAEAVQNPFWYVYLGRAACPPYLPLYDGVGRCDSLEQAVQTRPWYRLPINNRHPFGSWVDVTAVVECRPYEGERRHDEIVSRSLRTFQDRFVKTLPPFRVIVKPMQENPCFKPGSS